ncbi:MAG: acyltransferase family protein [Isosphaeraceae bacterium]
MSTRIPDAAPSPVSERLVSLDAFRGMTIAGMILVNNPGSWEHVYGPLRHAEWHGFTPTDLVFPSFLFIAGVAIPLALGKRLERGDSTSAIVGKVVRRAVIIFALGLLLHAFPFDKPLATLRIPGVLQRIALCYLVAGLLAIKTSTRGLALTTLALLVGYWGLLTTVPVPGIGAGDLSRPNNLAAWIDRALLPGHLYKPDYDPEGVLSTLPAIATTLIGVLAGRWLSSPARSRAERVSGLFAAGVVLTGIGTVWDGVFPINKALWTSSFAVYTAGLSLLSLGLCAWLIEIEGWKRWAWPFLVLGSNAIAAYVLSGLLARVLGMVQVAETSGGTISLNSAILDRGFAWCGDPTLASFLYALSYVLVWVALMAVLHRAKIFIRI